MITFFIFLLILGLLIIIHEFGHFIVAKRLGVRVEKFSFGFGRRLLSKKRGDTEYSINLIPLGGYVKLAGDSLEEFKNNPDEYLSKKPSERCQIIFCGPLLNYILGFLLLWITIFCYGYPKLTAKVGNLKEGFGAKDAGMQVGDKIIAVEGKKIEFWEDLVRGIQDNREKGKVLISVLRNNQEHNFEVKLKEESAVDMFSQKRKVSLIGIEASNDIVKIKSGLVDSLFLSIKRTYETTVMTYKAIGFIITGKLAFGKSVMGILGMYQQTSEVINLGVDAIFYWIALLSISLAIFNLLPLPVLDGGHIVLLAIEKIRGKQLSVKAEHVITHIGFTLIVSLAVFVTYNDLLRLFGDKLSKFINR